MNSINYHRNHLLNSHKQLVWLTISGMALCALTVITCIVWSFGRYRQATRNTYVFHHKGAALSIYDERNDPLLVKPTVTTPYQRNR
ncbi:hypothetical protein A6C57_26990 (plasmid) [Fibrella sp. ES10-3-2-2]